jgi:hypothetical protein
MKNTTRVKIKYCTVYLLIIVGLMQVLSIALFPQYGDIAIHLLTREVSFIFGLILFWGIISKRMNLYYDSEILLTLGIILMIIPSIQNGFSEFAQQITLFEGKTFNIELNTSLWGVGLSFPYLAKHFEPKSMKKFWIAVLLLNTILVLQISYSFLILFNITILTLIIKHRKALNRNAIGIYFLFSIILFVISYKANSFIFCCEFTDFFDNQTVINSTNHWFEGFMGVITGGYGFWGNGYQNGLLQGTGIYHDLWLTTYMFGFAGFVILMTLVFVFLEFLINTKRYKAQKGISNLQFLASSFFIIYIILGFINGFDLIPINLNTGFPFISFYGINDVLFFIMLGYLFYHSNQKIGILTKNRKALLAREVGINFFTTGAFVILLSLILFVFITGIHSWLNKKDTSEPFANTEVVEVLDPSFSLGIDSVLYDKSGKAYTTFYNPGDVFNSYLAVRDNESGK